MGRNETMEKLKTIIDDAMGELEGTLSSDQTDKVAKFARLGGWPAKAL